MIDILNGNNFFAAKMKASYDRFKQEHSDEKFTFEDYQHAALNTRAFQYESIEDKQQKKEFWRDIIIGIGLVVGTVAAIACPPAAPAIIALGATYGALELGSAASGKDWMTGRELGTGERWFRGAFSLLDIVPGVKGLHAFGKAAQAPEAVLKAAQLGTSTNLKTAVKQGRPSIQAMLNTAAGKATQRVRQVQASARDVARKALENAKPGIIQAAKKTDELLTSVKNMKLPGRELVPAEGVVTGAKNTHSVENSVQKIIQKAEGKLSPPPRRVELTGKGGLNGKIPSVEEIEKTLIEATSNCAREIFESGVSKKEMRPCLSGIYDPLTGKTYFGQNFKNNATMRQEYQKWLDNDAEPIIKDLVKEYEFKIKSGEIKLSEVADNRLAAHSELRALDQVLKARRELGLSVDRSTISELFLHNIDLYKKIDGNGNFVTKIRCEHCRYLTDGINTIGHN